MNESRVLGVQLLNRRMFLTTHSDKYVWITFVSDNQELFTYKYDIEEISKTFVKDNGQGYIMMKQYEENLIKIGENHVLTEELVERMEKDFQEQLLHVLTQKWEQGWFAWTAKKEKEYWKYTFPCCLEIIWNKEDEKDKEDFFYLLIGIDDDDEKEKFKMVLKSISCSRHPLP
jgi:hypothetical protein